MSEPPLPIGTEPAPTAARLQFRLRHLLVLVLINALGAATLGVYTRTWEAEQIRRFAIEFAILNGAALIGGLCVGWNWFWVQVRTGKLLLRVPASVYGSLCGISVPTFVLWAMTLGLAATNHPWDKNRGFFLAFGAFVALACGGFIVTTIWQLFSGALELYEWGVAFPGGYGIRWHKFVDCRWKEAGEHDEEKTFHWYQLVDWWENREGQTPSHCVLLLRTNWIKFEAAVPLDQIEAVEQILMKYLAPEPRQVED